jgi:hypothetical protein
VKKVALISANLGAFDPQFEWVEQVVPGVELTVHRFTDASLPPRPKAMTSRMLPGIAKMFGWQLLRGFDAYIWVDASRTITHPGFAAWMLRQLGWAEMALFRHPLRATIAEEYRFVKDKMAAGSRYLRSRYEGEWLDEQMDVINADLAFRDDALYASTAFAYYATAPVRAALTEWWHHKTRYLLHDQLALPYVIWRHGVRINVIDEDVYNLQYWEYTRKGKVTSRSQMTHNS